MRGFFANWICRLTEQRIRTASQRQGNLIRVRFLPAIALQTIQDSLGQFLRCTLAHAPIA